MSIMARLPWSTPCCARAGSFRANQQVAERALDFERARARARHHDPGQMHLGRLARRAHQHRRHARATPISAARSSASSAWSTACWCWSTPPKGRCRRPSSCSARRCARGLRPIVVINKIDRPDARAGGGPQRDLRPVRRARRQRGAARFPDGLRLGPQRLGGHGPRRAAQGPRPAVRADPDACASSPRPIPMRRSRCWRRRSTTTPISAGC